MALQETDPDMPMRVQESLAEMWVGSGQLQGQGHWGGTVCMGHFEGDRNYLHYLHHSLVSGQTTGREHSPTHQQKIGLKIYWAGSSSSEQDPVCPTVSLSHQEASISLLPLSHRGKTERKPQSQKTNQTDHGPQPCITQWNYEPCCVGPPKMDRSWWRFWPNVVHWRREWQATSVFLTWEPHEQYKKAKR